MKIALLTRNPKLYSHQRIIETAEARGHKIVPIDYLRCYMAISKRKPEIHYQGVKLTGFDAVIPRIAATHTFYGSAVLRQFEMMGVYPLNESVALGRSRDKFRSLQLLARDGVNLPRTAFANDPQRTDDILKLVGGAPVVIKLLEGTQGIGVVLGETHKSAKSVIQAFQSADINILVQQFVVEARGRDIRVLIIGNKIVAAMERIGPADDFRSNLARGGTAKPTKLTAAEKNTALKAVQSMGLNVAGVDMLRTKSGTLVVEVNSSPGLEGVEEASGADVATAMIAFLEKHARPWRTQTRGRG